MTVNRFLLTGLISLGILGCTGEKPFYDISKTEESDNLGKISISVKTTLSEKYLVTRAVGDKIAAESDEAKVNSLKVYLFTKDGANGTEDDYVLYKNYDFDNSKIKTIAGNSQVSIAIESDFMGKTVKAVIIANDSPVLALTPKSTKLTEFRKALASANVTTTSESDVLVGGANKSFPMSCVTGDINTTPKGNSVNATLVRSMARIDILNFAKDLYITSVKLTNVNNKSCLLGKADAGKLNIPSTGAMQKIELKPLTEYSAKITGTGFGYDATHDAEGTEAICKANKHRTFYLYEQEVKDEASSPKVTIEYIAKNANKEKNGKIEVVFKKTTDPKDWVNVKRNHIYTIQLGEEGKSILQGKMKVRFIVDDWDEVIVPSEIDTDPYATTAVGDYMLKDGTTVKPDDLTPLQQYNRDVIGIVAYMYKAENNVRLKEGVRKALNTKGVANPHGLVMSFYAFDAAWRTSDTPFGEQKGTLKDVYDTGADGYTLTTNVWNANKLDEFPAFKATKEFGNKVKAPENTTGWYIPSLGEWIDMLGDKGLQAISKSITDEAKNSSKTQKGWPGVAFTAMSILNRKMEWVNVDYSLNFVAERWYWTSSESSSDPYYGNTYYVGFYREDSFYYLCNHRYTSLYVRPILAF